MKFYMSNNAASLRLHLAAFQGDTVTVEAEYGDEVVEGGILTMAHHGPRAGAPAPCSYPNYVGDRPPNGHEFEDCPACGGDYCAGGEGLAPRAVGLSHLDLDTIGGCAALLGLKPDAPKFWELAEFVDLRGAHRLAEAGAADEDVVRLCAWWAWSESHRCFPPRDGSVADVTSAVEGAVEAVRRICTDDPELLAAGAAFKAAGEALNASSFRSFRGGVVERSSDRFTSHLYALPGTYAAHGPAVGVVALNTSTGAVTVSFADEAATPPGGAVAIVQGLWGPLAGGHKGIAGSPRGQTMTAEDMAAAVAATRRVVDPAGEARREADGTLERAVWCTFPKAGEIEGDTLGAATQDRAVLEALIRAAQARLALIPREGCPECEDPSGGHSVGCPRWDA